MSWKDSVSYTCITEFFQLSEENPYMKIVNNRALLERFLEKHQIKDYFSLCQPRFQLLRYSPGELLTTPFTPSQYLQFIVKGELLLYDMPNENSSVSLQTSRGDLRLIGDMELLDITFVPFFVEARTEVYTAAISLEQYRETLLQDPVFLRHICFSLAGKLRGATDASLHISLRDRLTAYISRLGPGAELRGVARLAEQLNASERQMIRVLKSLCEEGVLQHEKAGRYRVLRCPGRQSES